MHLIPSRAALAGVLFAIGGLLAVGVLVYVTGTGKSGANGRLSRPVTVSRATRLNQRLRSYGEWDLGIAYGTTPQQVLREIGSPTLRQGDCWLYRGRQRTIRGRYSGSYVDAMKFCFSAGPAGGLAMTKILSHYAAHTIVKKDALGHVTSRTFYPAWWGHTFTILRVPDWYRQENS